MKKGVVFPMADCIPLHSPRVSVVMAVYNCQRYLDESVQSILGQTLEDFEFIIVDDGSTDRSLEILQSYQKEDSRIRLVSRPNTGLAIALNDGIAIARGDYIARMDADDVALSNRLQAQVDFLDSYPKIVAAGTSQLNIDEDGDPVSVDIRTACPHMTRSQVHHRGIAFGHPTAMIRRSALSEIGGYRDEYNGIEDKDLWFRLLQIGELASVEDVLLKYRVHLESISHNDTQEKTTRRIRMYKEHIKALEIPREVAAKLIQHEQNRPIRSAEQIQKVWARSARRHGFAVTARKYAYRLILANPRNLSYWLLCLQCLLIRTRPSSYDYDTPNLGIPLQPKMSRRTRVA